MIEVNVYQFDLELVELLECINQRYNYDFRHYAPASLKRTVIQAMTRMGCSSLQQLQSTILNDPASFTELIQSMTIPVSEMFRDPNYYKSLREKVLPHLKTYPSLKVWIAGCSTGEEVYSIAILLHEEGLLERSTIYATDINSRALAKAEKGTFPLEEIRAASRGYEFSGGQSCLSKYYSINSLSASFHDFLKKNITFTDHSLVTDSVFSETHLISCRNVLIYFDRELQDRAFGLFYDSLRRKCFLGLGSKETMQFSQYAHKFNAFAKDERIYQKN